MWQWVARGNNQTISHIPQTEQHAPFRHMLLHLYLGNVTVNYYMSPRGESISLCVIQRFGNIQQINRYAEHSLVPRPHPAFHLL